MTKKRLNSKGLGPKPEYSKQTEPNPTPELTAIEKIAKVLAAMDNKLYQIVQLIKGKEE